MNKIYSKPTVVAELSKTAVILNSSRVYGVTYSCKEVYLQCASLTGGDKPFDKIDKVIVRNMLTIPDPN